MEVSFYHLQRQPLDAALPILLEKALERGWRAIVRGPVRERLEALDTHLWTYDDASFLPHGLAGAGPDPAEQPVLLTDATDNPNGAACLFLLSGAPVDGYEGYTRTVLMFDGNDEDELAAARAFWKDVKAAGHDATYWQQTDRGGWTRKA